jgi:hypothetical protein
LLLAVSPALGHHSFSAQYDDNKPVALTGAVTKIEWMNPHGRFYIDVKDSQGNVVNWEFELAGLNALIRNGWTRNSLKAGDMITVEGFLARDGSRLVNVSSVVMSDGKKVFSGVAPR